MPLILLPRLRLLSLALFLAIVCTLPGVAATQKASLAQILSAAVPSPSAPFSLYRWDRFPAILIFDTADFRFQDRMFSRLAFFLEKRGFRGHLLDNDTLKTMHGWNAHDYGAQGLADFFNAASLEGFHLNAEEITLRDLALEEGTILTARDRCAAGQGGIISISRSSTPIERRFLLIHESFHGIFFASAEYRAFCFRLWDSLRPGERAFFRDFLNELGYDGESPFLAVNEFQAYLMQQPVAWAPAFFQRTLSRFGPAGGDFSAAEIERPARALASFLESRFGIRAGGTLEPARAQAERG
ncbi:MAG TPA: hypothetical protein VMV03_03070 [Spirochaetia bacterium]|nr:hypothetical protein [Spirochaetia bacterium]